MKKAIIVLALVLTGCATQQAGIGTAAGASSPCHPADNAVNATLWMQTSAEYQAVTREVYATALHTLDEALTDKTWTAAIEQPAVDPSLPPAIVLDIDETILDTSGHEARLIR